MAPNLRMAARDFMDLVASTLTKSRLDALYESKWTCQAVLRSLPPLAKVYVLRLLFLDSPVSEKDMQEWLRPDAQSTHRTAIDRLVQLNIFITEDKKKDTFYHVNAMFKQQLRLALSSGMGAPGESLPSTIVVRKPSLKDLEDYATRQWESIVLQLVSFASPEGATTHNSFVVQLLQNAGLLTTSDAMRITQAGFQFLLMDRNSQLWRVIREYVRTAESREMDTGELIRFLLEIGFYTVGEPYSFSLMTNKQQRFIEELKDMGILQVQQGTRDRWFIPTKLAAGLSASLSEASSCVSEGFIMVETNFKVYAYTRSRLHKETLQLFVRTEYVLPNMIVGSISKESINHALASGISAEQIILFLQQHAHPHVSQKIPTVPDTVCDQIRLWDSDRVRVQYQPVYLYEDFPNAAIYDEVVAEARKFDGLLWEDPSKKRIVVQEASHEEIRSFMRTKTSSSRK